MNKNLFEKFIGTGIRAYADDIIINFYNKKHLKAIVQTLEKWSKENFISLNKAKGKSHVMYFKKTGSVKHM